MLLCCSCITAATGVALLYALFDVNYFIRIAFTIGFGRLFQKKIKILEGSTIYGKQRPHEAHRHARPRTGCSWKRNSDSVLISNIIIGFIIVITCIFYYYYQYFLNYYY
jgi:hypothetical protein